jgi:hypothetical protein
MLPRWNTRRAFSAERPGWAPDLLKQLFYIRKMLVEVLCQRGIAHDPRNLARLLRGEVEHQAGAADFVHRLRLQDGAIRSRLGTSDIELFRLAPARLAGPLLHADDV